MTDTKKRKLMKALAAGGGVAAVADRWAKPVVRSVLLPAHAQATCGSIYSVTNTSYSDFSGGQTDFSYIRVCAVVCGNSADVTFQSINECGSIGSGIPTTDNLRTGVIPIDGSDGSLVASPNSNVNQNTIPAHIEDFSSDSLTLVVPRTGRSGTTDIRRVVPRAGACVGFLAPDEPCPD